MLKMSPAEKAKHEDLVLQKPDEVYFNAIRVWDLPDSVKLEGSGKVKGKENKTADGPGIASYLVAAEPSSPQRPTAPEVWSLHHCLQHLTSIVAQEE
jgi:hypothetical protein